MGDLNSALDSAFDEARNEAGGESEPTPAASPSPEHAASEAPAGTESPAPAAAQSAQQEDEPTGDVLLDKLTPDQIADLKRDPRLKAIYKGLMSSYTPKMQQFAEQARLWDALNNPQTQKQAIEALARTVGLNIEPSDAPQKAQVKQVADEISEEWSNVVGPEAAQLLRPLIEKTAKAAIQGQLEPLQKAAEFVDVDARTRQADAQVSQFKALAAKNGWNLTPEVEQKMAQIGMEVAPTRRNPITGQIEVKPIESVEEGVRYLERIYHLATAGQQESEIEKRIYERMTKAAQSAEPARGVPSTGREKRSNITKGMSLSEALDVGMQEAAAELGWTK